MLNEISWDTYIAGAGVILLCYYAGIAICCYRHEIGQFLRRGQKKLLDQQSDIGRTRSEQGQDNSSFELLERTIEEINSILKLAGKEASKPELLLQLKQVLANYDGLRQPAYRVAVFNHIIHNAKEICGLGISVHELEG
jgi:hypothetical protein